MSVLSLQEAADQAGASKVDVWRAIQDGQLPARRTDGGFAIDADDLFRVFERRPREPDPAPDETPAATAAPNPPAAEGERGPPPEPQAPPDAIAPPEKAVPSEMDAAMAALAAELKSFLEPNAGTAAKADLPPNPDESPEEREDEAGDRGAPAPAAPVAAAAAEPRSWRRWLGG